MTRIYKIIGFWKIMCLNFFKVMNSACAFIVWMNSDGVAGGIKYHMDATSAEAYVPDAGPQFIHLKLTFEQIGSPCLNLTIVWMSQVLRA